MSASAKRRYRPETQLVQAGILRSPFGETSEALFLTQGYVYETAASAERRFKGEEPGYQYSRFSNPTVTMFEQRMAALEGAPAARATATGMAAVTTALMGQVRAGDHIVASKALFGSCLYVVEEHIAQGSAGQMLAHALLESGEAPARFTHRCAQGYLSGRYGSQGFHRRECGLDAESILRDLCPAPRPPPWPLVPR